MTGRDDFSSLQSFKTVAGLRWKLVRASNVKDELWTEDELCGLAVLLLHRFPARFVCADPHYNGSDVELARGDDPDAV